MKTFLIALTLIVAANAQADGCGIFTDQFMYMNCLVNQPEVAPEVARQLRSMSITPKNDPTTKIQQEQLYQMNEAYRQQRQRDMILQHGAGGRTPNFATGGCL